MTMDLLSALLLDLEPGLDLKLQTEITPEPRDPKALQLLKTPPPLPCPLQPFWPKTIRVACKLVSLFGFTKIVTPL